MPLVVFVDEGGVDLLMPFKNIRCSEGGARLNAKPLSDAPLMHLVPICVFQYLQEQIDLGRQINGLTVNQRHALGVHQAQ